MTVSAMIRVIKFSNLVLAVIFFAHFSIFAFSSYNMILFYLRFSCSVQWLLHMRGEHN